jgi:hypothetical protein
VAKLDAILTGELGARTTDQVPRIQPGVKHESLTAEPGDPLDSTCPSKGSLLEVWVSRNQAPILHALTSTSEKT